MNRRHLARPQLAVTTNRGAVLLAATVTLAALAGWAAQHAVPAAGWSDGEATRQAAVRLATFGLLAAQTALHVVERPRRLTPRARRLAALHVAVIIPVYNEDPGYLHLGLESLLRQTRLPDGVHVVDYGSTSTTYDADAGLVVARGHGQPHQLAAHPNRGKRHAQASAVAVSPEADE